MCCIIRREEEEKNTRTRRDRGPVGRQTERNKGRGCRRGLRGNGSGGNEKCQRPFLIKVTACVPAQVPAPPENEQEN